MESSFILSSIVSGISGAVAASAIVLTLGGSEAQQLPPAAAVEVDLSTVEDGLRDVNAAIGSLEARTLSRSEEVRPVRAELDMRREELEELLASLQDAAAVVFAQNEARQLRRDIPTQWNALRGFAGLSGAQRTAELLWLPASDLVSRFGCPTWSNGNRNGSTWTYSGKIGGGEYLMVNVKLVDGLVVSSSVRRNR